MMKHLLLCILFLFVLGCSKKGEPLSTSGSEGSIEIYFLEDSSLTSFQAVSMDINHLHIQTNAWLTNTDIQFYDFSSHCIYLKRDKSYFFENDTGNFFMFHPILMDKPFVVVANNERCYVGALRSALLSTVPTCPFMDELDVSYFPKDVMHISRAWSNGTDVRNNALIKDALISLDLYHGGISVTLKSVNIVENFDTATVDYDFIITNNDQDNLFVIDLDKMGVELFHYFTNGVVFNGSGTSVQSIYKKIVTPSSNWNVEWFTEIPSHTSMERMVRLRGYSKIGAGNYNCSFIFADPNVEKENRSLPGGRIWLGAVVSSTVEIGVP